MTTPARITRARSGASQALPVTSTNTSNAYGARGTTHAVGQLAASNADFSEAFESRRRPARQASRESSMAPEATPAPARSKRGQAQRQASPVVEQDEEASQAPSDEPPASNLGTAIDTVAPYEPRRSPPRRRSPPFVNTQPSAFSIFFHTVHRALVALKTFLNSITPDLSTIIILWLGISYLITFWAVPRLGPALEMRRDRITRAGRILWQGTEHERPPEGVERDWYVFKAHLLFRSEEMPEYNTPDIQWAINLNLVTRLEKLEKKTDAIAAALANVQNDIEALLPRMVVVDKVDGQFSIPEELYTALQERLRGDHTLWQAYLDSNQQRLDDAEDARLRAFFADAEHSQQIVSSKKALELIRSENDRLVDIMQKNNAAERAAFVQDIRDIAVEAVTDVLSKNTASPSALDKEFFIQNTLEEMQNLNYFSPKAGARIIDKFTSPTARVKQPNIFAQLFHNFFHHNNLPHTALTAWKEYADSWCAAASTEKGKAQIGIRTMRAVVPSELVIEHIPASGTPHVNVAPRDVELWMYAGTAEIAQAIHNEISQSARYRASGGCSEAPDDTFVCVGRGKYDIHHENWVQKLPVFIPMDEYDLKSKQWIVRVNSNWGGDFTCLYRLRLHGKST